MRTKQRWHDAYEQNYIKKYFPPRIQQELPELSFPNLPQANFAKGQGLYLYGENTTGKTLMSAKLLIEEKKRMWLQGGDALQRSFEFINTPKLLFRIRQTYDKKTSPEAQETLEEQLFKNYSTTYFLVLDDFGAEGRPTEWVINTLYLILNERYEQLLPTVFTSNKDLNDIAEIFDDRIASRIERGCIVLEKQSWEES